MSSNLTSSAILAGLPLLPIHAFRQNGASPMRFSATAPALFTVILASTGTALANLAAPKEAASVTRAEVAVKDASGKELPAAPPF